MPAPDGGDDLIRIGTPDEGSGLLIMLLDETVDGGLQVDDGVEDAVPEAATGQFGEEAFDRVQPGTGRWYEVERPARVAIQPGADPASLLSDPPANESGKPSALKMLIGFRP